MRFPEHIIQLYSSKTFDMKIVPVHLYLSHQLCKELKIHFRVNAPNNMHFRYGSAIIFLYNIQHLFHRQFPSFISMSIEATVGTEIATEYTYIGRLDMEIAIEVSDIA